jgi:cytochrome c556
MRVPVIAAVAAVSLATTALGAATLPKDKAVAVMHDRHEGMETIGKANKVLRRELASASPNLGTVRQSAAQIQQLSRRASGWFPAGTGPEVGKTGAKPEIWKDPRDFSAKLTAFQKAAQMFDDAARRGDLNAIKARYADLGGTCKVCHDKYRMDMQH